MIGSVAFTHPWLLLGLLALPLLWLLLRAVPPAPLRQRFPAVALLLGLEDEDSPSDRTPWWLILLRMLCLGALITGLAGPVLNPARALEEVEARDGPLLVLVDATWAQAPVWEQTRSAARAVLEAAQRAGRPVALRRASGGAGQEVTGFEAAQDALTRLPGVAPNPWGLSADLALPEGAFDTVWISDGLDWPARSEMLRNLRDHGQVRVQQRGRAVAAITEVTQAARGAEPTAPGGELIVRVAGLRPEAPARVDAVGPDPAGIVRVLASAEARDGTATLDLPLELRNRVTRLALSGVPSAGAVWLTGASLKRPRVGLVAGREGRETAALLSPLHYLRQALDPNAELTSGTLADQLAASPDAMVLSDVATLTQAEADRVLDWVAGGGILIRFAGDALSRASGAQDPLLPVRLREGGRDIGGALSWTTPKAIAPFDADSPFYGLEVPEDITVRRQVLAEPSPDLSPRVIARLEDGTPLVTRRAEGQGQIVLFHVSANAEWSGLPLSGLFVEMLDRLLSSAGIGAGDAAAGDLAGMWQLTSAIDALGALIEPLPVAPVPGETLSAALDGSAAVGPDLPPGIWQSGAQVVAVNAAKGLTIEPAVWPADIVIEGGEGHAARSLTGPLLALALVLFSVDVLAAMALVGGVRRAAVLVAASSLALALSPEQARAQSDDLRAVEASAETHLAYVITGDARVDEVSRAGLYGLSNALYRRTAIEPGLPMGVDIETDELVFFPMLYWPVTESQPLPSAQAVERLNRYLRGGGMIVFDTKDADLPDAANGPAARRLQAIAAPLAIPPLAPLSQGHVLTRSFYLLSEFPGRHAGGTVWVEAGTQGDTLQGMSSAQTDGVTPVVIGSNDWAGAWATDEMGAPLLSVGRGAGGARQREVALRFGVNLVMHVLTGNYKNDQVHVPALLQRLGEETEK